MAKRSRLVYGLALVAAASWALLFVWSPESETKPRLAAVEPHPAAPSPPPPVVPATPPPPVAEAVAKRDPPERPRDATSPDGAASRGQRPGYRVREISWPAPEAIDALFRESLPAALKEAIDRSRVPVLLPRHLATSAELYPGAHWYTASNMGSDPLVIIHGTNIAHRGVEPRLPARATGAPDPGRVTPSDGTLRLTWEQYGVFYFLDIVCRDPAGDSRCSDPEYARSLRDALAFVGGRP